MKHDILHCPDCGSDSEVIDTRPRQPGYVWRRRECLNKDECGTRWTTYEVPGDLVTQFESFVTDMETIQRMADRYRSNIQNR
jgi:hypothetical protein